MLLCTLLQSWISSNRVCLHPPYYWHTPCSLRFPPPPSILPPSSSRLLPAATLSCCCLYCPGLDVPLGLATAEGPSLQFSKVQNSGLPPHSMCKSLPPSPHCLSFNVLPLQWAGHGHEKHTSWNAGHFGDLLTKQASSFPHSLSLQARK
jgi:hypothetical protein